MENLNKTILLVFERLKLQYPDEDLKNQNKFKLPYESRDYGFMRFILFGVVIDIEILASYRKIVAPYVIYIYIYINIFYLS